MFLSQERSGGVLMESTHDKDQTDKVELYQRKGTEKELVTFTTYQTLSAMRHKAIRQSSIL